MKRRDPQGKEKERRGERIGEERKGKERIGGERIGEERKGEESALKIFKAGLSLAKSRPAL